MKSLHLKYNHGQAGTLFPRTACSSQASILALTAVLTSACSGLFAVSPHQVTICRIHSGSFNVLYFFMISSMLSNMDSPGAGGRMALTKSTICLCTREVFLNSRHFAWKSLHSNCRVTIFDSQVFRRLSGMSDMELKYAALVGGLNFLSFGLFPLRLRRTP